MEKLACVILAAGQGKRMNRKDIPKVLNTVLGKPMVQYVVELALNVGSEKVIVVIGHQGEKVKEALAQFPVEFVWQHEQLGTGHAVLQAAPLLRQFDGNTLVLYGDVPLLRAETIENLLETHRKTQADLTLLTTELDDSTGYGHIIRDKNGKIVAIVEDKDATPEQKAIKEINPGIYIFKTHWLLEFLPKLSNQNVQGEYYLTDMVDLFQKNGRRIETYTTPDSLEIMGVNTVEHLKFVERILLERKI
ncbi:MAG: NTP transferase domain-containing protein [Calditrichaeota bacterium]|nr:NTP transferase domain-containing protein [Calditrichota bacterium]